MTITFKHNGIAKSDSRIDCPRQHRDRKHIPVSTGRLRSTRGCHRLGGLVIMYGSALQFNIKVAEQWGKYKNKIQHHSLLRIRSHDKAHDV